MLKKQSEWGDARRQTSRNQQFDGDTSDGFCFRLSPIFAELLVISSILAQGAGNCSFDNLLLPVALDLEAECKGIQKRHAFT